MAKPLDLSIIIPVAPGADPGPAMRAVAEDLPRGVTAEIITVAGTHPTRQRNLAAMRATGRYLYFLDHDAIVRDGTVKRMLAALHSGAAAVGGPNLPREPRSSFERRAAMVIGSTAGVGARYRSEGVRRRASEFSLILCNLAMSRQAFLDAGGFDPRLYPNEENELLNRIGRSGAVMLYEPEAAVEKPRPVDVHGLLKEGFRYGRGRLEQVWVDAFPRDAIFVALLTGGWIILAAWGQWRGWQTAACVLAGLGVGLAIIAVAGASGISALGLAAGRYLAYFLGMTWGALFGWRKRRVRLTGLAARFLRYSISGRGEHQEVEQHVFHIGSWSKEVPARA